MASRYNQISSADQGVHFSKALFGEVERSRMVATPRHITTFNAGDIVPIYCREVLPNQDVSLSLDFVIRQTTLLTPTMGNMHVDIYAFFVPNRIVNASWKAVMGENFSGSWTANKVSLAPLVGLSSGVTKVPPMSVADYYGFPTQLPIPNAVLSLMNDLKFRGYLMIYNEHFRDQNYQPPIPFSTLNVYEGFFEPVGSQITYDGTAPVSGDPTYAVNRTQPGDGSVGAGAIQEAIFGQGKSADNSQQAATSRLGNRVSSWSALSAPLKANKLHDYFTSVLPDPQKSPSSVLAPVSGQISSVPVVTSSQKITGSYPALLFNNTSTGQQSNGSYTMGITNGAIKSNLTAGDSSGQQLYPANMVTMEGAEVTGLELSINDLRMASAIQQLYEVLASGGSRYVSLVASFFGVVADDPYSDIPKCLGKISRDLELFQTAQTSESGSTPQGTLAGFGYTSNGGHLFSNHFLEHGYIHVFAVVRHKNIYPAYLARDNFRLNMLDFYFPSLANISNQPVYTREVNPFAPNPNGGFGFQEAFAEYRFEPDMVSGLMRPGPQGSENLSLWNYADDFDQSLQIANGEWLKSNSQKVLDRTLAVQSTQENAPQFKGMFRFVVDKELPMPTFSVPGMDII